MPTPYTPRTTSLVDQLRAAADEYRKKNCIPGDVEIGLEAGPDGTVRFTHDAEALRQVQMRNRRQAMESLFSHADDVHVVETALTAGRGMDVLGTPQLSQVAFGGPSGVLVVKFRGLVRTDLEISVLKNLADALMGRS